MFRLQHKDKTGASLSIAVLLALVVLGPLQLKAQEVVLPGIVIVGDKTGRTINEASPSTTVISGEEAVRPSNIDIDSAVATQPNILANEGFNLPSIRGVDSLSGGRPSITAGSQPRTPLLVDGVAYPSNEASAISALSLWDVSTIEVARGPQPTSTGRNAFGGAIRVFTNDPTFKTEVATRVGYISEQGTVSGAFMFNAPVVSDQIAVRLVGEGSFGKSYVDIAPSLPAGFDPEDERYGRLRGKVLIKPSTIAGLSVVLSVDHSLRENPTEGLVADVENVRIGPNDVFALSSAYEDLRQTVYQAKSTYEISRNFTLVSRLAHLDNDLTFRDSGELPNAFVPFALGTTEFNKSQIEGETYLQFRNIGMVHRGVVGVTHNTEDEFGTNDGTLNFSADGEIRNTGVYGEIELSADGTARGLSFLAGGRLEIDKRERSIQAPIGNPLGGSDLSETVFLPKIGLRYYASPNASFGYTYSQGFRAGGTDFDFTGPIFGFPLVTSDFDSETIDQHEIFARGSILGGTLDLTATAFYYTWKDAQVAGAGPAGLIGNVPVAIGYGGELAAAYKIMRDLSVKGAVGFTKTKITDAGVNLASFEGNALPRAPEVTLSGGIAWSPFEGFTAGIDARYVDDTVSGLGQPKLSSYTIVDISAGYKFEASGLNFKLDGFIKNVFDERYRTFAEQSPGFLLQKSGRPRTFGFALTTRY
ncbi:MAG: TonB-dependent receptor [Pseudomonadota bacterium]